MLGVWSSGMIKRETGESVDGRGKGMVRGGR